MRTASPAEAGSPGAPPARRWRAPVATALVITALCGLARIGLFVMTYVGARATGLAIPIWIQLLRGD